MQWVVKDSQTFPTKPHPSFPEVFDVLWNNTFLVLATEVVVFRLNSSLGAVTVCSKELVWIAEAVLESASFSLLLQCWDDLAVSPHEGHSSLGTLIVMMKSVGGTANDQGETGTSCCLPAPETCFCSTWQQWEKMTVAPYPLILGNYVCYWDYKYHSCTFFTSLF